MELKPEELKDKQFRKRIFGGFQPQEVTEVLDKAARTIEQKEKQILSLEAELRGARERIRQLEAMGSKLMDTIKETENSKEQRMLQADQEAQLKIREAEEEARRIISETEMKGKRLLQEADRQYRSKMQNLHQKTQQANEHLDMLNERSNDIYHQWKSLIDSTQTEISKLKKLQKAPLPEGSIEKNNSSTTNSVEVSEASKA
ncbi:DivIVA domain-containing protein [Limibacter armeniacum]|uniref:DivIVA domain-containing protein n=1 Tax=Limibacter armeniacum TaxID=466084 RepID=UPI002FE63080